MSEELKCCPFCGGISVFVKDGYGDITYISCPDCYAICSFAPKKKGTEAIKAYNQRALIKETK